MRDHRNDYKNYSKDEEYELKRVRYVRMANGIYTPETQPAQQEVHNQPRQIPIPIPIRTQTDWWAIAIQSILSACTLLLLSITAYVATLQWREMAEATRQTKIAADAATKGAKAAEDSTKLNRQLAEGTQAAIIAFNVANGPIEKHDLGFKIYFVNIGHVVAQDFRAKVTITKESLPEYTRIGNPDYWAPKGVIPPGTNGDDGLTKDATIQFDDDAANRFKQTVRVQADISYDNGFGRVTTSKECRAWFKDINANNLGWKPCQDLDALIRNAKPPRK